VDEQTFRYNKRKDEQGDSGRFQTVVRRCSGKRLTYKEVTGKVDPMAIERRTTVLLLVVLMLLPSNATAAEKKRNWQTGKVLDSERSRYFAGTVGNANTNGAAQANGNYGTYQGSTNTSQTAIYRVFETFLIEGETTVYLAQERLKWRWSKAANLTVNVTCSPKTLPAII
jgi:hypothetical protein